MKAISKKGRGCRFDSVATPSSFMETKRHALKCASQLGYFKKFPQMETDLENSVSVNEINRIMSAARKLI